jgi:taurine dioxygenase
MYQQTYRMQPATAHPPQQSPARYSHMRVSPVSGALGAEVTDVDLEDCDAATFAELERALNDHLALFVRDQTLDPEQQIALARRFGPPMPWPYAKPMPGYPEITELRSEPEDQYNFGGSWHQDSLNFERPPRGPEGEARGPEGGELGRQVL